MSYQLNNIKNDLTKLVEWKKGITTTSVFLRNFKDNYLKGVTMYLSEDEVQIFYKLWLSLLEYTNKKYKINPKLEKLVSVKSINPQYLIPFRGKIIYDSIILPYNIVLGSGIKKGLNEDYRNSKIEYGIITTI